MTVAALPSKIDYLENGLTVSFALPFRFLSGTILATRVLADGTVVALAYGTDFTTTGGSTDAGGVLLLTGASVEGATLRARRGTPRAQVAQYVADDSFPAESHEQALDRSMLVDQEQDDKIADTQQRAFMVQDGQTVAPIDKAAFAGKFYAGGPGGDLVPASGTGADAALREDIASPGPGQGPDLIAFDPDETYTDGTAGGQLMDRQNRNATRLKLLGGTAWPFMDLSCEWIEYGSQTAPISPDSGANFTTPFGRLLCLGPGHKGGAQTGLFMLDVRGLADASQTNWNYVALQTNAAGVTSVGGTDETDWSTSDGALFGLASHAILYPGATAWLNVTGLEVDVVMQAGSSAYYRSGIQICEVNGSVVQAAVYDAALSFGSAPGSVGWKSGILFSAVHGQNAVVSTGALMETRDGGSYAHGVNLTSATFANNAFSSAGFAVNGAGDVTARFITAPVANAAVRVGSMSAAGSSAIHFRTSGATAGAYDSAISAFGGNGVAGNGSLSVDCGSFAPTQNNHASLGSAGKLWTEVFAGAPAINTSDLTQKAVLGNLSGAEFSAVLDAIGEVPLLAFQFNAAIAKKGVDGARIHAGIGAQDLHAAFERHGVDPFRWSVLCRDPDFEEVQEEYEAERPVRTVTTTSDYETVIENGVPVRRLVTTETEHDAFEDRPVVDENGDPVMLPAFPERRQTDVKTGGVTVIKATPSVPLTHPVPLMETYTATRTVVRRRKDENGDDAWIWGVRYEEFLVLRHAWLERAVAGSVG